MISTNPKDIITLDFETFFSNEYSLRNKHYNISSYIRDPQFEAQICSIKYGTKKAKCYYGDALLKEFAAIDWANSAVLAHHMHFDGLILSEHFNIVPGMYLCTLSMSRALHPEYASKSLGEIGKLYGLGDKYETGEVLNEVKGKHLAEIIKNKSLFERFERYCNRDVELTFDIYEKQHAIYPPDELRLIDMTIRMFATPVLKLDIHRCKNALDEAIKERQTGIAIGCHAAGLTDEKDLTSNPRFVAALASLGVEAPTKISKTTGEHTYALAVGDEEFLDLLNHEDPRVVKLVQGRIAAKSTIEETRAARLLAAGKDGASIPVYLNYYGAKTGRWSGGDKLNFQNMPRGSELRKSIIAPDKHVIVVCDSAQIEARVVNWVSGNQAVLDVFANKEDVYCYMASIIYGRPITKKDKDERFIGKIATLGLGYGMGAAKFRTTLALGTMGPAVDMPLAECTRIVNTFRQTNRAIVNYWNQLEGVLARIAQGQEGTFGVISYDGDGLWLPNGMGILYPGLRAETDVNTGRISYKYWSKTRWSKIYGGLATENVVQALAGVIIRQQMLWYDDWLRAQKLRNGEVARIVTMSHDEIVSVVPERLAKKALAQKLEIMRTPPDWCSDLPLDAEGGFAMNYSK